ncbi:deoxyribose-phosphate aldolase [Testicularia cyperi]|uniref:deoxyribose-phosphate aldolase n=1 Tax=Testicularia cyperi TaxID=1882483 RepID=A0A317XY35_9BASI|nr:deoxyribose-phosphate aldolase [Testicularia cyperi]
MTTTVTNESLSSAIQELVQGLSVELGPIQPAPELPSTEAAISMLIDHTLLAPNATLDQIRQVCAEAKQYQTATVCVNSSMIPTVAAELDGSGVLPISVIGFPFGSSNTESKVLETRVACQQGAKEIDMVNNIGLLRSGEFKAVFDDIKAVADETHLHGDAKLKVILETAMLTRDEIIAASYLACLAGSDFVKTSTGYGGPGAKPQDIRLMYEIATRTDLGWFNKKQVKASGGIRSLETLQTMVQNGATRVGASGTKAIIEQLRTGQAASTQASGNY